MLVAAALMLINPGYASDLAGLALLGVVLAAQKMYPAPAAARS